MVVQVKSYKNRYFPFSRSIVPFREIAFDVARLDVVSGVNWENEQSSFFSITFR